MIISNNTFSQSIIKASISVTKKGGMKIKETLNDVSTKYDTLVFNKNINLKGNEEKLIKGNIFRNTYLNYINSDGSVNYSIQPPKSSFHNFFFHDSIFFISADYLGVKKEKFNAKKKYNLNIDVPEDYTLIHPRKQDLENALYDSPPIIAGVFEEFEYNDFCVYYRPNLKYGKKRMNAILNTIENSFNHFQTIFSKKGKQLEIIFLPFKNMAGKNLDNLIILNENILTNPWLDKKTLIHETLHQWWGDNSIKFENPVLTEAITEFFSFIYLDKIGEKKYLTQRLIRKKKRIQSIKKYDFNFNKIFNAYQYNLYSYDLLPLILWSKEYQGKSVVPFLINFFKVNKQSFIDKKKCNQLLKKLGIPINTSNPFLK